jgi:hypothetical protein
MGMGGHVSDDACESCGGTGVIDMRLDNCGGEPGNPGWFGHNSEHDLAGSDGYCHGCPDCEDDLL